MTEPRVPMLSLEESAAAAESAGLVPEFARLNVFRVLLKQPVLAKAIGNLLLSLLVGKHLDARLRELVIMRLGWATRSEYEWTQHWPIALRIGLREEEVLAVRAWPDADVLGAPEKAVLAATDEVLVDGAISPATFRRCATLLGSEEALLELVGAIGCWRMISSLLQSLDVPLEDGTAAWPPDGVSGEAPTDLPLRRRTTMFIMRFDLRAPAGGASTRDLYAAAIEMAEWGEQNGCIQVVLSEHHGSDDGYLPSPLVMASALAARTRTAAIQIAALIVPLHDPIRLAEDMAVLDIVSGGRVSYVVAVGYVASEFAMFDRSHKGRGKRMEASLEALRSAWTGEAFEYEGRTVLVRPVPVTPGGPMLLMGGNSSVAAKRAARFGMGMIAQGLNAEITDIYEAECKRLGKPPGMCINPPPGTVTSGFVAEDVDRAWDEIGPYLLHDARAYARWMTGSTAITKSVAETVDELRASRGAYQIFTPDEAIDYVKQNGIFLAHPLCGGLPPELAWPSLKLLASEVLPRLNA